MTYAKIVSDRVHGGYPVDLLARITAGSQPIDADDIKAIRYQVAELNNLGTVVKSGDIALSALSDVLRTDPIWVRDSEGFNFAYELPADALPKADVKYVVEVIFTRLDDSEFKAQFHPETEAVRIG